MASACVLHGCKKASLDTEIDRLRTENEAQRKRIAELEAAGNRLGDTAITGILDGNDFRARAEQAEKRVRELEENLTIMQGSYCTAVKIAEQAEAQLAETTNNLELVRTNLANARTELAEAKAERDAIANATKFLCDAIGRSIHPRVDG